MSTSLSFFFVSTVSHYQNHQSHQDHRKSIANGLSLDNVAYAVPVTKETKDGVPTKGTEKKILKKYDARRLLAANLRKLPDSSGYWGGPHYVRDATYSDVATLARGFLDASTLYGPSLVRPVQEDVSVMMNSLHLELEEEKEMAKTRNLKKIRAVRSGLDSRVKPGAAFWGCIPSDLLRKTPYNADVEAIELLLAQASQKHTGRTLNLMIWILGVCPPPEAIEKVSLPLLVLSLSSHPLSPSHFLK